MDTKRRAGGSTLSLALVVGFGRELLLSPPRREKTLDMLGGIMSPESFYLFMVALGCGGLLYFSWPVVQWVAGYPERANRRRQESSPSNQFRKLQKIIVHEFNLIERDIAYEHEGVSVRSQPSKFGQRKVLQLELSKCGVATPDPRIDSDQAWYDFLTHLVPLSLTGSFEDARTLGATFDKRKGQFMTDEEINADADRNLVRYARNEKTIDCLLGRLSNVSRAFSTFVEASGKSRAEQERSRALEALEGYDLQGGYREARGCPHGKGEA